MIFSVMDLSILSVIKIEKWLTMGSKDLKVAYIFSTKIENDYYGLRGNCSSNLKLNMFCVLHVFHNDQHCFFVLFCFFKLSY